jgi:diphosphoinositol-polyphosphate diphosphatase
VCSRDLLNSPNIITFSPFRITIFFIRRLTNSRAGYGSQGERLVAGVVPLSTDKYYVLLIQSTRRGGWVLPKGGWETDEATAQDAAKREAWEEAGIICKINYDLGLISEKRKADQLTAKAPKASYHFFEATVEKQESVWPEQHKRSRNWFTYNQARAALAERPELLDALDRCTMHRT